MKNPLHVELARVVLQKLVNNGKFNHSVVYTLKEFTGYSNAGLYLMKLGKRGNMISYGKTFFAQRFTMNSFIDYLPAYNFFTELHNELVEQNIELANHINRLISTIYDKALGEVKNRTEKLIELEKENIEVHETNVQNAKNALKEAKLKYKNSLDRVELVNFVKNHKKLEVIREEVNQKIKNKKIKEQEEIVKTALEELQVIKNS